MVAFATLQADERLEARLMTQIVLRQFFAGPGIMGPDHLQIKDTLEELLALGVATKGFAPRTDFLHRVRDDIRVILNGLRA